MFNWARHSINKFTVPKRLETIESFDVQSCLNFFFQTRQTSDKNFSDNPKQIFGPQSQQLLRLLAIHQITILKSEDTDRVLLKNKCTCPDFFRSHTFQIIDSKLKSKKKDPKRA